MEIRDVKGEAAHPSKEWAESVDDCAEHWDAGRCQSRKWVQKSVLWL